FNILINKEHEAVYDLNRSTKIYEKFKTTLVDEGNFQRPIIIKHVVLNETFRLAKRPSENFLSLKNLPYYLRAIEHSAVIRKKYILKHSNSLHSLYNYRILFTIILKVV